VAAELTEVADGDGEEGDEDSLPAEEGVRLFGHSKDHRDDLPQVVIAMAVTRDGIPVRCWTFPGSTPGQKIIRKVKDDLGAADASRSL
jgi:transposase